MKKLFFLFLLAITLSPAVQALPLRTLPGLVSVTFYEVTTFYYTRIYPANDPIMTTRLGDPLGVGNTDFNGTPTEFYDVFYSNADGTFNIDGEYITVEVKFDQYWGGGGLNIANVQLNFGTVNENANMLTSSVFNGTNQIAGTDINAADGNANTFTTMGNTYNMGTAYRVRITVGFPSSVIDPVGCESYPCGNGNVLLCHVPPGNPGNQQTICIPATAAATHISMHQDDYCGPCLSRRMNSATVKTYSKTDNSQASSDVYPQPSMGQLTFAVDAFQGGQYQILLMDAAGKVLRTLASWEAETGVVYQMEADLSDQPAGAYLYLITRNGEKAESGKLMITR